MRWILALLLLILCGCGPVGWCTILSVEVEPAHTEFYHTGHGLATMDVPTIYWAKIGGFDKEKRWCTKTIPLDPIEYWEWDKFHDQKVFIGPSLPIPE